MAKHDKKLPTTTVSQSRLCLFHPSKFFKGMESAKELKFQNELGEVRIKNNRLTQIHRSILDVIFTHFDPMDALDGHSHVRFNVSRYGILNHLGNNTTKNYDWLLEKLEELASCVFAVKGEKLGFKRPAVFHIINNFDWGIDEKSGKETLIVEINKHYLRFMAADRRVFYPSLIGDVIGLKYAETQALARLFLSQNSFNRTLSNVMSMIGLSKENGYSSAAISRAKKRILEEKDYLFEKFGIRFGEGKDPILYYQKGDNVWTIKPNTEQLDAINNRAQDLESVLKNVEIIMDDRKDMRKVQKGKDDIHV